MSSRSKSKKSGNTESALNRDSRTSKKPSAEIEISDEELDRVTGGGGMSTACLKIQNRTQTTTP